jgi:hypothetical protein
VDIAALVSIIAKRVDYLLIICNKSSSSDVFENHTDIASVLAGSFDIIFLIIQRSKVA